MGAEIQLPPGYGIEQSGQGYALTLMTFDDYTHRRVPKRCMRNSYNVQHFHSREQAAAYARLHAKAGLSFDQPVRGWLRTG